MFGNCGTSSDCLLSRLWPGTHLWQPESEFRGHLPQEPMFPAGQARKGMGGLEKVGKVGKVRHLGARVQEEGCWQDWVWACVQHRGRETA